MMPDGGQLCETEMPPWREVVEGHRIFCHLPLETLQTFEPIIKSREETQHAS
jgi:peptide/nickel transport system ATP-binding protein